MRIIKKVAVGIRSAYADFRKGLSIISGKPSKGEGDRKLAKLSLMVEGQISTYGKDVLRTQVIKSVEGDLKRAAKKGPEAVEVLVQNALQTPEYMHMLKRLGLEEPHVRVMAMSALKAVKVKR